MKIIKRDGTPQEYNFGKIKSAVSKAFNSVDQKVIDSFLLQLNDKIKNLIEESNYEDIKGEEIEDIVSKETSKKIKNIYNKSLTEENQNNINTFLNNFKERLDLLIEKVKKEKEIIDCNGEQFKEEINNLLRKKLNEEVKDAVNKAFNSIQQELIDKFVEPLKEQVEKIIEKNNGDGTPVEEVQDIIQKELIKKNKYDVVEAFILYRKRHEEIRENKSKLIKDVTKALNASDVKNQNANLDEASFGGRLGEAAGIVSKNAALKNMSKMARKNHEEGFVYIHDLDHYEIGDHNCLSCKFDDLLRDGFKTRQTTVRGANSVNTAMQLVAVIFQLQSLQQFGGVAGTHIDWSMVPYVRKSFYKHYNSVIDIIPGLNKKLDLTKKEIEETSIKDPIYTGGHWYSFIKRYIYRKATKLVNKEIHQAVEGMYHNLNTLQSRSGNQLPFTSINYGTCTLKEGRMITKSLLEVSIEGLGKNNLTSIFPCGIFQYKKGINDKPGTPNYDLKRLALKSDVRRIYPNWANCDWSNQVNWFKQDRFMKQEYIDNLSKEEYENLVNILEENPKVAYKLGLELE